MCLNRHTGNWCKYFAEVNFLLSSLGWASFNQWMENRQLCSFFHPSINCLLGGIDALLCFIGFSLQSLTIFGAALQLPVPYYTFGGNDLLSMLSGILFKVSTLQSQIGLSLTHLRWFYYPFYQVLTGLYKRIKWHILQHYLPAVKLVIPCH